MTDGVSGTEHDLGFPINVEEPEDLLSDYQAGRVGAVFRVGEQIERLKEETEREAMRLEQNREGVRASIALIEKQLRLLQTQTANKKVPLKQAEYGSTYLKQCLVSLQALKNQMSESLLRARYGSEALEQATKSVKTIYDDERLKLQRQEEYLKERKEMSSKERVLQRPPGVNPGNPLEDYKNETVDSPKGDPVSKKITRKKSGNRRRSSKSR